MAIPMPAVVVLIVCKTVVAGPEDPNAAYTGYENRKWATEHSMMMCRRQEVQLFDQSEAMGADAQPFNMQRCQRSGIMLGTSGTPVTAALNTASGVWLAPFQSFARTRTGVRISSLGRCLSVAIVIRYDVRSIRRSRAIGS